MKSKQTKTEKKLKSIEKDIKKLEDKIKIKEQLLADMYLERRKLREQAEPENEKPDEETEKQ